MTAPPESICAYCAAANLTGSDPPEHVVPHALGASFTVSTVCQACNSWASREVDQPFLRDEFVLILRNVHGIRPPGKRRGQLPPNPILHGVTEDGTHGWVRDGQTYLAPTLTRNETTGATRIRASSIEEAERLARRVERDAAARGIALERQPIESGTSEAPWLQVNITSDQAVWARMAAKITLAAASHVFGPAWRLSPIANDLRHILRDEPSKMLGDRPHLFPVKLPEAFAEIFEPQEHALWFQRGQDDQIFLMIVLFGDSLIPMPAGVETDHVPVPAWRLDSRHPRRDGRTDFFGLLSPYLERLAAKNDAAEEEWADDAD